MTLRHTLAVIRKDITGGPKVMMVAWLIAMPLVITLVLQLIFGGFIDSSPRLGVVDLGNSEIPATVEAMDGIRVSFPDSVDELKRLVTDNNLDAGLVLPAGFDEMVRAGDYPQLEIYMSGESLATDQAILAITAIDLVRGVAGEPAPVDVVTEVIGNVQAIPIKDRVVPLMVLLAVTLASVFLPAASLVQEREKGTIGAVLTTPAHAGDVMVAKGTIGFVLGLGAGLLTLALNTGVAGLFWPNVAVITVGALMCVPIGLMVGSWVPDMQTMFTVWKGGATLLFAPAVLLMFPSVPRWISMIFPTYYFLGPINDINVNAVPFVDVLDELGIGLAITLLLMVALARASRSMVRKLAIA